MSWRVPEANEPRNILGSQALGNKDDSAGHNSVIGWLKSLVNTGMVTGQPWFVDSVGGLATYDGKAWTQAKATIATAVALASAGDTIFLQGSFSEAVTSSLARLRFIGIGTGPQATQWTAANDGVCLTINATQNFVSNIKFSVPAYTSGIPAAIKLLSASYGIIDKCLFQGKTASRQAIYSAAATADSDNFTVRGCKFKNLNTATHGAGIWLLNTSAVYNYGSWSILDNVFESCVTGIKGAFRFSLVKGNSISNYGLKAGGTDPEVVLALGIDLSGAAPAGTGGNVVTGNTLGGAYTSTLYKVGATGDIWRGNYVEETATTAPYGLSLRNPA